MKKKKMLPLVLVIFIVLLIFLVIGKKAGWFGNGYAISVSTEPVKSKTIIETITANGKIQPQTVVKISPDVSGEIIELYIKEGDFVKEGDPLCVIKPDIYISAVNRAEAALNSSKARLAQAKAQQIEKELMFKRAKQLYKSKTIPISEYETAIAANKVALAEVKAAKYSIKSAEATVEEAKEQLVKTRIFAPISGTISALNVEKGERVVGTNMYAGTEMMIVAELDRMEVQAEVNENDIVKVSLNDSVLIEVDAYMNRKFRGIVTEIANSATVEGAATDQVTNFDVKVFILHESYLDLIDSLENNIYPFRPGMSATVDIITDTRNDVVSVPIAAVTTRVVGKDEDLPEEGIDDKEREVVFIVKDEFARQIEVVTGIQDNESIEVIKGLEEGDQVITAPYNAIGKTLKDSMTVKVISEKMLFKGKK